MSVFCGCPSVCFSCPSPVWGITVYAMCLLLLVGYDFEGSPNTSRSLSVRFVRLNLSRSLQLLSVSQSVQNLDFVFIFLLDLIRYRVQGYEG